jgi:hypothetical protein
MRMQIRRFTRLTNAFSKSLLNLKDALALHFAHYNFVRIHGRSARNVGHGGGGDGSGVGIEGFARLKRSA